MNQHTINHPIFDDLYFFGRFNFPHIGYLYVIRESLQQLRPKNGLQVIFSAEHTTWDKKALPMSERETMFSLAIQTLPKEYQSQIHFSDIERELQKKLGKHYHGYTIDTLRALLVGKSKSAGLVMGADAALGIPGLHPGITGWHDWEEILKLTTLIIVPRGRYHDKKTVAAHLPSELKTQRIRVLDTTPTTLELHASSTRIQDGNHSFLPGTVKNYALHHALLVQ